jgi:hypothetical protein
MGAAEKQLDSGGLSEHGQVPEPFVNLQLAKMRLTTIL